MKKKLLYKGSLQTIVLKLLLDNERLYGYEITQLVKKMSNNDFVITEGALYPCLHKLESEGFLQVEVEKVDHRIRKYYKLTQSGEKEVHDRIISFMDFVENMQQLTKIKLV
jgi:PadR family transcriptional regulator, regulatory protein PadR